ncbi:MAG TPA: ATP-binding protein [Solirubrobacter sp.]|nr:ATP-binding protein [Solirubrobacter sp.]
MTVAAVSLPAALEEGVIIWDPSGSAIAANATAERMVGPELPTVLLSPDGDPLPPEQWPAARAARTSARVDQELGVPRPDGGVVWLSVRSARLDDGSVASAFVTIGEAEAKARSAARIAAMIEETPDLVWMFDGRGLIEYASPSVCTALGLRQDELIGRLWRALTHPDDVPVLRAALASSGPDEPRTPLLELRLRAADGTWRSVEGQATLRFRDGVAIAVEVTGRDVTRTRAAEEHGKRLSSQLEALVAGAPDGIVMIDADDRIAIINEQACSLLELGDRPTDLAAVFDGLRALLHEPEAAIARLREIAAGSEPVRFEFFECRDGRRIGCDFMPLDAGKLWLFRDITRFKLMEEEQRAFLATMSHEIKTPLSGIAGAAELLREAASGARERELAEVIGDAAQSLSGLLRDALDVSRAEAGREQPEAVDYDPQRLLASVAGVLRPSLRDRPLSLEVAVDPDVPAALRGDAARVRQIVLNLASNAVKYTESGEARIHAAVAGSRLLITVSDTGPGIAADDLPRLFEPWTRGHGRAWAGTGLGLSIARRLARAMGGDVTVVSRVGHGSAFTLELPLVPGAATDPEPVESAPVLAASRVLVAEDDPALRRLIGMQLERLGAEATLVEHGAAAVEAARTGTFDAILLDLRMPVLGGIDAAQAIRESDADVPILALTADSAAEDVAACRAAGMDGHVGKPVSLPVLRDELDRRITPVLDEALLDELSESLGGRALVDQMLAVWRAALPERLDALRTAANPAALREAAHALRSPSAGFGFARLAARLQAVESAARAGAMAPLDAVFAAAAQAEAALARR